MDTDRLLALVAPDIVIHYAGMPKSLQGRETRLQGFLTMTHAFPDHEIRVDDAVAAEDKSAVRLTLHGAHAGKFQGVPATGRTIQYESHEFYRAQDGLIAEAPTSLFRQLS